MNKPHISSTSLTNRTVISLTSCIINKILNESPQYCCLCFQTYGNSFYNLHDEIVLDNENAEDLYEILSAVLGKQVLPLLSTEIVCQKCTETAIMSYKFIETCKNNIHQMSIVANCLHKYTNEMSNNTKGYKSLFLVLNTEKSTVNHIYDKKQNDRNKVRKRYKYLCRPQFIRKTSTFTLDIESVSVNSSIFADTSVDKITDSEQNLSVQFLDISIPLEKGNDNGYKCENCLKIYPTLLKFKQHYLRMHAPKNFKCSKCPRSFGSSFLLNKHTKECHCVVVCSQCGKTYNNTYSLRHHEEGHKSHLVCNTCGKVYKGKVAYRKHIEHKLCDKMRKTNAEAKFSCSYCNKKYSQKAALKVHIRLEHENGKALICDWCGKKLASISRLKDHILTHTKQKNFSCTICGGNFVTKTSLLYHTRTHTGEKPYKCDSCDMRFLSASRRLEHVKRHHMGPDLECDICHGKFKGQTCLTKHRKKHFDASSRLYSNLPSQDSET